MDDCWSNIIIISNEDELITLIQNELMYLNIKNKLLFHDHIKVLKKADKAIKIKVLTSSKPNFHWMSNMIHRYKSCWIKNNWYDESGLSGVWIGTMTEKGPNIIDYQWCDLSIDEEKSYFNSSANP
jgi:hypothetical protein